MSYILDALKKADAQRERDPARGIHAQPVAPAGGPRRPGERYRAWFWGAGAVGLAVAGAFGWYASRDQGAVVARTGPASAVAPLPAVPSPAAVVPVTPPPEPVATEVMPPAPPAPPVMAVKEPIHDPRGTSLPMLRGRPQQVAASPPAGATAAAFGGAPPVAGASAVAPLVPPSAPARPPAAAAPPAPVVPPPPPPRSPVIVPTPPVVGLPPDAPKLIITGGVYSTNPAQRMLIVNGQVVNQGADLGAGVTLEEIKPKAAVMVFRGARYSIAY